MKVLLPASTLLRRIIASRIDETLASIGVADSGSASGGAPFLGDDSAVESFVETPAAAASGNDVDLFATEVGFVADNGADVDGGVT